MNSIYKQVPILVLLCMFRFSVSGGEGPFFASGIKVGEVSQSRAIVWVRLTEFPEADFEKLPVLTEGLPDGAVDTGEIPPDLVPGKRGEVSVQFRPKLSGQDQVRTTEWMEVRSGTNFTHQFKLEDLLPGVTYSYTVCSRLCGSTEPSGEITGEFTTAPRRDSSEEIRFIITTCQAIRSIDSGTDGHVTYRHMLDFNPHFFVHTGDIVYYDKAPLAKSIPQARSKWNLMYAYANIRDFHRKVSSYFMKDDHDTLKNDCWQGQSYGSLTFEDGLKLFREQVPMGEKTYRTYRWGKDLQIWLTENRDFRSPNTIPDGPRKTILGDAQMAWLKKTLEESDATYKFVITPGPIVGPDKAGKADNHSNEAFAHEGQELRDFLAGLGNTYVICGDRHWQYCSEDPVTGLVELGCGPINDIHNYGGNSGLVPSYHRYFDGGGGFLGVTVSDGVATAEWFKADEVDPETGSVRVRHREVL